MNKDTKRKNYRRIVKRICISAGTLAILFCANVREVMASPLASPLIQREEISYPGEESRNTYREDYYGAQLNDTERKIYEALYEQYCVKRDINAVSLTLHLDGYEEKGQEEQKNIISNLIYAAVTAFLTDYQVPLSDGYRWECESRGDEIHIKCHLKELYTGALGEYEAAREGIKTYKARLDEKLVERFGEQGKTDRYSILLTIHDDLIERVTYSYSSDRVNRDEESDDYYHNRIGNTLASVALDKYNHFAVCQGYMAALKELCSLYEIPCVRVDKKQRPGEKAGHSWAYVKLEDGNWYSLDVTLDDLEDGEKKKTFYRHFLTGIAELDAEHIPYIPLNENGKERLAVVPRLNWKQASGINMYPEP